MRARKQVDNHQQCHLPVGQVGSIGPNVGDKHFHIVDKRLSFLILVSRSDQFVVLAFSAIAEMALLIARFPEFARITWTHNQVGNVITEPSRNRQGRNEDATAHFAELVGPWCSPGGNKMKGS